MKRGKRFVLLVSDCKFTTDEQSYWDSTFWIDTSSHLDACRTMRSFFGKTTSSANVPIFSDCCLRSVRWKWFEFPFLCLSFLFTNHQRCFHTHFFGEVSSVAELILVFWFFKRINDNENRFTYFMTYDFSQTTLVKLRKLTVNLLDIYMK